MIRRFNLALVVSSNRRMVHLLNRRIVKESKGGRVQVSYRRMVESSNRQVVEWWYRLFESSIIVEWLYG